MPSAAPATRSAFSGAESLLAPALLELGLAKRWLGLFRRFFGLSVGAAVLFGAGFAIAFLGSGPRPMHWAGLGFGLLGLAATLGFRLAAARRLSRAKTLARQMPASAPALRDPAALRAVAAGTDDEAAFLARAILSAQSR
jgi:hypothetical protein